MSRSFAPTEEELQNEQFMALNSDTSDMYGLIHARYIRSPEGKSFLHSYVFAVFLTISELVGLALIYGRYLQGGYGYCPRAFCDK